MRTINAEQGRASVGHLHVDAAAVAAASLLALSLRASQLFFDVRTVGAEHGPASFGHLHGDAAAVAAAPSLTWFFARLRGQVSSCSMYAPKMRCRVGPKFATCSSTMLLWLLRRLGLCLRKQVSSCLLYAPWVRCSVGPVLATCTSMPLPRQLV